MAYIKYPFEKTSSVLLADDFMDLLPDTDYTLKLTNLAAIAGNGNILVDLVVAI